MPTCDAQNPPVIEAQHTRKTIASWFAIGALLFSACAAAVASPSFDDGRVGTHARAADEAMRPTTASALDFGNTHFDNACPGANGVSCDDVILSSGLLDSNLADNLYGYAAGARESAEPESATALGATVEQSATEDDATALPQPSWTVMLGLGLLGIGVSRYGIASVRRLLNAPAAQPVKPNGIMPAGEATGYALHLVPTQCAVAQPTVLRRASVIDTALPGLCT
ncbi:MAG: hypothetical protein JWP29_3325 [Rhodoferax sp.]|nr:hypothetical protein [Rhodoferax sp.]